MADSSQRFTDASFPELCADALTRAGVVARNAEQEQMLGLSEFLVRMAQRDPAEFQRWLDRRDYEAKLTTRRLDDELRELALQVDADDEQTLSATERLTLLQQRVRALRYRVQRVVIWRHLSGRAALIETTLALSALADGLLGISVAACARAVSHVEGDPLDEDGRVQQLVVFGLGKLGGRELNLSSDIDLICAYPAAGKTSRSGKTNQQYFVQVVQRLVKALGETTGDGFGFRVDLRLRPYGDSGPVVQTFAAMERYFETNGRDWERYALIKARPCAGDIAAGEELLERLRPFVYRRYLDFAAIASMRDMRALIRRDADTHKDNVKLGAGGIRDIEFLAQMLQLIWGGRVAALRTSSLSVALDALVVEQLMAAADRDLLWQAYEKFRDTEHTLQAFRDEQTHTLPAAGADQLRLAVALGQPDFGSLVADLQATRDAVLGCAGQWLDEDTSDTAESTVTDAGFGAAYWRAVVRSVDEGTATPGLPSAFEIAGGELTETIAGRSSQVLRELRQLAARDPEGAVLPRLDALMPGLLDDLRAECNAAVPAAALDETLLHIEPLLKNVLRRSAYLVLLSENENVRQELARLARRGGFFTALLARHPALLEELFLRINLAAVPTLVELRQELATLFPQGTATALTQQHFDRLAQYKSQHQFRSLLALTRDDLNVMQLADYLTLLAQSVIECVLRWAATAVGVDLIAGATRVADELVIDGVDAAGPQGFVVIGYGKLGGYELSANSDLDVVFLHDWGRESHAQLHKLARRVLNYLGMQTYFGELYEVDIRLRPAGRDGMMASTLEGFAGYQRNSAWLWEHQALVRARPVAGDAVLAASFATLRREILQVERDRTEICGQIVEMREKMRSNAVVAAGEAALRSDLKQGVGGIVDIEFMVQYLVLGWAAEFPSLLDFPDNARILEQVSQAGLLPDDVAAQLIADYARLRQAAALAALGSHQQQDVAAVRERVAELWQALMVTHRLPA